MRTLTYKQLAFILDIKPVEALEKIIAVHCKTKCVAIPTKCDTVTQYLFDHNEDGKNIGRNKIPDSLDVGLLAVHLNLPTLQQSVEDIKNNFLKRPSTKKWILCDYPEKELLTKERHKVKIPPVLASMLTDDDLNTIKNEWRVRHKISI